MLRRCLAIAVVFGGLAVLFGISSTAQAQDRGTDWDRFYHYPYVYYPHNFWASPHFSGFDHPYYKYPEHMRIPVYNRSWYNFYPSKRKYHHGKHFVLDVF